MRRSQYKILENRLLKEDRKFIQVIHGPRQVGKTTLIRQFVEEHGQNVRYLSADAMTGESSNWISSNWERVRSEVRAKGLPGFLLIIDEIQKIGEWSELVKKEWDYDTFNHINIKVVLLGSSRLLIQKGLSESLAGRFETIYVGHWTFKEVHQAFGINEDQYAWFGSYPGAISLIHDEDRWKEYIGNAIINTSIKNDILMMTRIDKPALLENLFYLGCNYSGKILSYNKMLGHLQDAGNTTTLTGYLNLLDTAGMLSGLEKFSNSLVSQKSSSPKLQVQNNAFYAVQRPFIFKDAKSDHTEWGQVVESAVGAHLFGYSQQGKYKVYYWRERNNEVDFVIQSGEKIIGIEVKAGYARGYKADKVFGTRFDPFKFIIISDTFMPWKEFIRIDPSEFFL